MKKLSKIKDRLIIWAIHHFNVPLPDLLRTERPQPGKIYYYYGRWLKVIRHDEITRRHIIDFTDRQNMNLLDMSDEALQIAGMLNDKIKLQQELSSIVCSSCPLLRIGLPCKKVYIGQSRKKDLCLTHRYIIIKGKNHDEEILTR